MTIGDAQKTRHPPENAVEQHLHHSAAAPQVRRRQIPVSPTPSVPSVAQNQAAGSKDRVDEEQKMKRHHRGEVDPSPLAHTPTADGRPEPEKRRKGAPARHRKVGSDLMEEEEEEMSTSETTLQSAPPNLPHAPEPPPPPAPQSSAATPDSRRPSLKRRHRPPLLHSPPTPPAANQDEPGVQKKKTAAY